MYIIITYIGWDCFALVGKLVFDSLKANGIGKITDNCYLRSNCFYNIQFVLGSYLGTIWSKIWLNPWTDLEVSCAVGVSLPMLWHDLLLQEQLMDTSENIDRPAKKRVMWKPDKELREYFYFELLEDERGMKVKFKTFWSLLSHVCFHNAPASNLKQDLITRANDNRFHLVITIINFIN